MVKKENTDSCEEKLQKLRQEIEKGWNGGISKRTIEDIIASKQGSKKDIK